MSQKKSEMIRKVYEAQNRNPAKNGWSLIVENDLKDIDFEENIENFSKTSFKKIVKEKIEKIAFKYLMNKKEKHSKLQDITYRSLTCQSYLKSKKFSNERKNLLFKLRTRMVEVKSNFRSLYEGNAMCRLCYTKEETQEHLIECSVIRQKLGEDGAVDGDLTWGEDNTAVMYEDIFSDTIKQLAAVNYYNRILQLHQKLLDSECSELSIATDTA